MADGKMGWMDPRDRPEDEELAGLLRHFLHELGFQADLAKSRNLAINIVIAINQTRMWMALYMGGAMAIIMLIFMLGMYVNRAASIGTSCLRGVTTTIVRGQRTARP